MTVLDSPANIALGGVSYPRHDPLILRPERMLDTKLIASGTEALSVNMITDATRTTNTCATVSTG